MGVAPCSAAATVPPVRASAVISLPAAWAGADQVSPSGEVQVTACWRAAAADDARRGEAVGRGGQRGDQAEAVRRLEHDLPPLAAAIGRDHDHRDVARPGGGVAAGHHGGPAGGDGAERRAGRAGRRGRGVQAPVLPSVETHIDWSAPCEPTATKPSAVAVTAFTVEAASRPSSPSLLVRRPAAQVGGVPEDGEGTAADHLPAHHHVTGAARGGPEELGAAPRLGRQGGDRLPLHAVGGGEDHRFRRPAVGRGCRPRSSPPGRPSPRPARPSRSPRPGWRPTPASSCRSRPGARSPGGRPPCRRPR